jgi:hypothetical protein
LPRRGAAGRAGRGCRRAQEAGCDGLRTYKRATFAVGEDFALHQHLAVFGLHARRFQQGQQRFTAGQFKNSCDAGPLGTAAHRLGTGPAAKEQAQRIDDDTLAAAGLSCQNIEPRAQAHPHAVGDRKVFYQQFDEHQLDFTGS